MIFSFRGSSDCAATLNAYRLFPYEETIQEWESGYQADRTQGALIPEIVLPEESHTITGDEVNFDSATT